MMRKIPTDLEIFNEIYDRYYGTFASFKKETPNRRAENYVPIDIDAIANSLGVDGDIVFGRLYYLHRRKYSYTETKPMGNEVSVPFFNIEVGKERHAIHFPLMAAILANLQKEESRYKHSVRIAWLALSVSIISVIISIAIPFFAD